MQFAKCSRIFIKCVNILDFVNIYKIKTVSGNCAMIYKKMSSSNILTFFTRFAI